MHFKSDPQCLFCNHHLAEAGPKQARTKHKYDPCGVACKQHLAEAQRIRVYKEVGGGHPKKGSPPLGRTRPGRSKSVTAVLILKT